jgi:hypothetical protein
MKEDFDAEVAHGEGLKPAAEYINTLDVLTEKEREVLKANIQYPGIQERVLEIKYTAQESDAEAQHRASILLEELRHDIKDFPR